ncbi:hypothetical protein ACJJTC_007897 [Scirpophaga incertulas]
MESLDTDRIASQAFVMMLVCLDENWKLPEYESKVEGLENKIEQLERKSRASTIEIRNIPKQNLENKMLLRSMVKKVGEVIEQSISDSDIQDVYRLKTKNESTNHIIVNFTTISCKDGFMKQCRFYNKTNMDNKLNTSHLNLSGPPKPLYIDESLTSLGKKITYYARQFIKDNNYHSAWSSFGKIFVRKSQDSPAVRIDCEQDLKKLLSK